MLKACHLDNVQSLKSALLRAKGMPLHFKQDDGDEGPLLRLQDDVFGSELEGGDDLSKRIADVAPEQTEQLQEVRKPKKSRFLLKMLLNNFIWHERKVQDEAFLRD